MDITLPWKYTPRPYQNQLWSHFVPDGTRKRAVVIAHRRWGKDKLCVNLAATLSQIRVGTYWHILPYAKQARAAVWNFIDTNNNMRILDHFPPDLVDRTNENEMRIHLKNGSIWQLVGGDDFNKVVGTNPIGVVMSEWALMDPNIDSYLSPILLENKGWSLKITTIRGKNHAYKDLKKAEEMQAKNPNWLAVNQTVNDTFLEDGSYVFSPEDIENERITRPERFIRQEYYNDPETPIEGAYYISELMKAKADGRVTSVPYEPKLPVDTYWDIGHSDATVIVFAQNIGMEIRVIDCYANSGEAISHYARVLREKDYSYGKHHGPWDVEIGHLAADGKSVYDVARTQGIKFVVTPQPRHVTDGIEQVRNIFPRCWFDAKKCERLLDALSSYRKEAMPENLQKSGIDMDSEEKLFKDKPLHDWSSDFCLTGDTLVSTLSGYVRLDMVQVGDMVVLGKELREVVGGGPVGEDDIFEITFNDGSHLKATGGHKLFTTGGLTRTDALRIGDGVLTNESLCKLSHLTNSSAGLRESFTTIFKESGIGYGPNGTYTSPRKEGCSECSTGSFILRATEAFQKATNLFRSGAWMTSLIPTGLPAEGIADGFRSRSGRLNHLMGSFSAKTGKDTSFAIKDAPESVTCIDTSGRFTMDQSQMDTTSITKTRTSPTTTFQTSNSSHQENTKASTPRSIWPTLSLGRKYLLALRKLARLLKLGTPLPKELHGIQPTLKHVVSVKPIGRSLVYDIAVKHGKSFVANGTVVSNCDAFRCLAWHQKKKRLIPLEVQERAEDSFKYL